MISYKIMRLKFLKCSKLGLLEEDFFVMRVYLYYEPICVVSQLKIKQVNDKKKISKNMLKKDKMVLEI